MSLFDARGKGHPSSHQSPPTRRRCFERSRVWAGDAASGVCGCCHLSSFSAPCHPHARTSKPQQRPVSHTATAQNPESKTPTCLAQQTATTRHRLGNWNCKNCPASCNAPANAPPMWCAVGILVSRLRSIALKRTQ